MKFLDKQHILGYHKMIQRDNTYPTDHERQALFYILSGNLDLANKVNHIYDFMDHSICPECLQSTQVDFSSSAKSLIRLSFNLYNNYAGESTTPLDIFYNLDERNYNLVLNGIHVRFKGMEKTKEQDIERIEEEDGLEL
jgi:hypothetical protein